MTFLEADDNANNTVTIYLILKKIMILSFLQVLTVDEEGITISLICRSHH